MKLLVSACLLGLPCRYDGRSKPNEDVIALKDRHELIPFCPEIYGGLPTPRPSAERQGDKVVNELGADVTENYRKGAEGALELCRLFDCKAAILKAKSPSCGKGLVYDGSFSRTLVSGNGVTAELLLQQKIEVMDELEAKKLL